ncbi:M48 family metalloprotease [Aquibacillus salsiterrae]|uniref:M48 family metalloprotease n=1 Tax=Aquibacillus salsiterrae TaxID=2950439 RepID=A0A9X4AGL8_9BACI|nr:M48 family metalloprotease [Aquibacillus salsiterrae]MDC3417248.1 M48 family metalloprotease [Aquibacillus salsiterrae]
MNKSIVIYIIYLVLLWGYFLYFYPLESYAESRYAAIAHAVYFSKLPLEWLLLYYFYKHPAMQRWINKLSEIGKFEWVRSVMFSFLLVSLYGLVRFPFNLLWFKVSRNEGTSKQPVADWLFEMGLDLLFYWLVLMVGIYVLRILMAKYKRNWWFAMWLLALPIAIFVVYIQPVWIDPLYEDFSEMEEGPLKTEIENFVEEVGLKDATLLQVNMSEKVTTFNAYVTGIFGNARIVLWDTTIAGMEQDEVMFILAHEIGHYVKRHVYKGVFGYLLLSFFLLYLTAFLYRRMNRKDVAEREWRAIPLLLLILSLLLTATQPVSMYVSRQIEKSADIYALKRTDDLTVAINSFKRLAVQSKSDLDPVFWVKWMRYSHPSISERIQLVEKEIEERRN